MTIAARSIVLTIATAAWTAGVAHAGIIDHTELPANASMTTMTKGGMGITAEASVRSFKSKTTNGTTGVGIKGGNVNGEIDGSESITFTFDQPVFITSLRVGQLYTDGNFGDVNDEAARFETNTGSFLLVADTDTTATWDGLGTASNISPGNKQHGGEWVIQGADIFGGGVTELSLMSGSPGGSASFGDYTFVELSYTAVPTPGALALAGLGALMGLSHRRKR